MTHLNRRALAWACMALSVSLVSCSGGENPPTQDGTHHSVSLEQVEEGLPTVESLETDRSDVDAVAFDFVSIVESHDTTSDVDEWSSLHRAVDLMLPALAKAQLAFTAGSADTDWDLWRAEKAVIEPVVTTTQDRRPPDTEDTAIRVFRAQIRPVAEDPGVTLPARERVHFVTLERKDTRWSVSVWQAGPLEESHQQGAGELSRENTEGTAS